MGKTIAVLGCGFNNIFPSKNTYLYKEIIEKEGLIISEYPPNEIANSARFLERNRIVSGISIGVLVVEAKYRSGTSVTARLAKEQGKKVFALPHEIEDINGVGTNKLIQNGAILVTSVRDIISEFKYMEYKEPMESNKQEINNYKEILNNSINKTNFNNIFLNTGNEIKSKNIIVKKLPENEEYKEIYELIFSGKTCLDEIYEASLKNASEINNILLMLELEGYIQKYPEGYRCS